jgi:hypothetical protein
LEEIIMLDDPGNPKEELADVQLGDDEVPAVVASTYKEYLPIVLGNPLDT